MNETRKEIVRRLLAHPEEMLMKKPFTRGSATYAASDRNCGAEESVVATRQAVLPDVTKTIVTQDKFMKELDPGSHEVLFDENMPSICVKANDGQFYEIKFKRTAIALQERIRQKQTLALCGNPRVFTLHDSNPDEKLVRNFADLKWHWLERNQDGLGTKAVYGQLGLGDIGLLMYFNHKGEVRGRIISYEDGYVIISHNDPNGERVMECVYYADSANVQRIDAYDDEFMYRFANDGGWHMEGMERHGFSEIPLVTKRGPVAWNDVQGLIETFEILYNIFMVIEKRHGWGILYVKGRFKEDARQIAGSIMLQDTSFEGNGDARFLAPPTPDGMLSAMQDLLEKIQIGSSVTFILPKDVKTGGDISGLAMQITRSFDIEGAARSVIEWQNFADKHARLFKEGLAKELVNKGENPNAVTEFAKMRISCKYKAWQPFDEGTYNQMLCTMKGAGIISTKTAVEKNTVSAPDELVRLEAEAPQGTQPNVAASEGTAGMQPSRLGSGAGTPSQAS